MKLGTLVPALDEEAETSIGEDDRASSADVASGPNVNEHS